MKKANETRTFVVLEIYGNESAIETASELVKDSQ
jgi:hypothetical protein